MNYNSIGITIGNKCNASCEICCMSSNPQSNSIISIEEIKKYLESIKNNNNIRVISFTGGEVFLYYNQLKELILFVNECDKVSTITTNGFWAKDLNSTIEILNELKLLGLGGITVSYDEFHQKYIPITNINNILIAGKEVDLPVSIQSVIIKRSVNKWIDSLSDNLVNTSITFVPCFPVGEAQRNIDNNQYIREKSLYGLKCRKNGAYSVTADGNIWPCCSPYITETALLLGNIADDKTVDNTIRKLRTNIILYCLRNYGFDIFIDYARENLSIDLPEKVISSCELCGIIFKKEYIKKFIPYLKEKLNTK
ncbi:MAG: radical SAM protein [Clostridium sp.]|uniref:radical SAM protein n=1 Tax=Clostridium sp. TaxID=1506 RepID=UPI002A910FBF|nr:radical SAM protein [Clostridium sp.]MDY6229092.1 radical SAM protein [Clostridium sp.]